MQFPTLLALSVLATSVVSSPLTTTNVQAAGIEKRALHVLAFCVKGGASNLGATARACNAYKARNKGPEPWNSCPDCRIDGTACRSNGQHIGGDEWLHYCEQAGADGSRAN